MSTKIADNRCPAQVTLDDGSRSEDAVYVGASIRGWVYRSQDAPIWYRVIPIQDAPLDWRHDIRTQSLPLSSSVLRGQRDWQQTVSGSPRLVIAYESPSPARSLAEILRDPDPDARMAIVVACLRALPDIWQVVAPPLFMLPADVIVTEAGEVQLLWIPRSPLPDPLMVLDVPVRVLHLAPELLRSATNVVWDAATWEAVERYAVGACLMQSYCELPDVEQVDSAIFRAAGGSLLKGLAPRNDLPPWLERFADHRNTVALLRRLLSPSRETRMSVDLQQLADRLDRLRRLLNPRTAVAWLRDRTEPKAALDLLQELFPLSEILGIDSACQYDLFCMAGELCASYLSRSLEALDYYERAIDWDPQSPVAYREQLRVIANARHNTALAGLLESSRTVASEIDMKLWRNYRYLAGARTIHAEQEDDEMDDRLVAEYLLWRQQYDVARDFIYPRLFDRQQTYIWWDFELNLAYVQAFVGLENGDGTNLTLAHQQLQHVKSGLSHVRHNRSIDETLVHQYGQQVADLEYLIFQLQPAAQPSGPSP